MKRRNFLKGLGISLAAVPLVGRVVGKLGNVLPVANGGTGATPAAAARMAKYKGEILRHAVPIEVLKETANTGVGFVSVGAYESRKPVPVHEIGSVDCYGPAKDWDERRRITFRRNCPFA